MPYLITGATGPVGRSIIAQLRAAQQDVRIVTRDPSKAPAGVEVVQGDFTQGDLPAEAFAGVRRVFLFPAQGGVEAFVAQAKRHNVERLVVLSSLAAAMEHERDHTSPSALHHAEIEKTVIASGIPMTFLRPGTFANNLLFWAAAIQHGDTVYAPYARSVQAPIHEADIAAVAVAALMQDHHHDTIYPLTGPQALSHVEQLDAIGAALGRQLHYQEISPEVFQDQMSQYMPQPIIKMLLDYWSDTVTEQDVVLPTVEQVTGSQGRTLTQWATDHAAEFTAHT